MSDEHARLSFSASERWLRCPASVYMSEEIPDKGGSAAAEEGTFAHKVMEETLRDYLLLGESEVGEITFPDDLDTSSWESCVVMAQHVQKCVDYIVQEYEGFPGDDVKMYIEEKVDLNYMTGRDDTWGTADVRIESSTHLGVYDLKYGRGIFVEGDTSQNRLYLLAGMCPTLKKTKGIAPWKSCFGMIMQPRYPGEDNEIFRGVEFEPQELRDWFEDTVKPSIGMTDDPGPPNPGEKQCRFCLAKPTCPAALKLVSSSLPFEPVASDVAGALAGAPEPADLSVDELIQIHDNIPFINGYLKSVSKRIRKLIEARDPRMHERLKLVVSRRNTDYTVDDDKIIEELVAGKGRTVKDGYIPKKKFVSEKPLTASQMLKLKLNDAQKARLQELITKSEGSLTIVPWSDPRDNAFPLIPFEDQEKVASEQPLYDFL